MDQNKDGDSDSRESYGLKVSELLKALAERKSPPRDTRRFDPRNISTTLSILKNTGTGTSNAYGSFRSRAVLPENISQLSKCQFTRRDHLSESLPASGLVPAPVTAAASSQEGQMQPSLPSVLAHVAKKSKTLPSDSVSSVGEEQQTWTQLQSCEPWWTLPKQFPQTGPTNEWFFEDLTDLQRKLFLGASKKCGVLRHSQTESKATRSS